MARQTEGYIKTEDGVQLFFREIGTGPRVVLPNGTYLFDDFKHLADQRTLIFYDVRNRGRSDSISDASKLACGILRDVDDLESVRTHFGITKIDLVAHSYIGIITVLYAMKYPDQIGRVVQIGPMQPDAGKQYAQHLINADATLSEVFSSLAQLRENRQSSDRKEFCERFWSALRPIYVVDPADAVRINWGRCDLPNELNFMKYWSENILPSIRNLCFSAEELNSAQAPILIIHGRKDRNSPYGGGREWALMLPNARLVTVENAAHAPWIEAPGMVFGSIKTFLGGEWPTEADTVKLLDPQQISRA